MRKLLILLIALFCLTSCYATKLLTDEPRYSNTYVGKSYSDIISSMGAPMRITPDGNGGTILIYEYFSDKTNGYVTDYGHIYSNTTRDVQYLHLYMNTNNICYKIKSQFKYTDLDVGGTIVSIMGCIVLLIGIAIY